MTESDDRRPVEARQPALPVSARIAEDVLWQQVDGQVVLLELNGGRYYALDPVGSRIWETLLECPVLARTQERLLTMFDVDETTLRRDLAELIDQMARARLVRLTA